MPKQIKLKMSKRLKSGLLIYIEKYGGADRVYSIWGVVVAISGLPSSRIFAVSLYSNLRSVQRIQWNALVCVRRYEGIAVSLIFIDGGVLEFDQDCANVRVFECYCERDCVKWTECRKKNNRYRYSCSELIYRFSIVRVPRTGSRNHGHM